MTTKPEVKLPELPKKLMHALSMHYNQAISYATGRIPVSESMDWHEKLIQEISAYAKQYGTLCYEAGLTAGNGQAGNQSSRADPAPGLVAHYDDDSEVWLGSNTGGAHKDGEWAELSLDFVEQGILVRTRRYRDVDLQQPVPERCPYCDDTGDVHTTTGEWRGICACHAGKQSLAQPAQAAALPTMEDALAAGDGTLHGAIDYWQDRALRAEKAQAAVPEGWKLVPIEPTKEMVRNGLRSLHENDRDESAIHCYRYMLNAAPDSGKG